MTKSSRFLTGHDNAQAVADVAPRPDEIHQDIEDVNDWVTEVRRRRG